MNAPPFENRWLITGTFTTLSELHVGDGGAGFNGDRARAADKSKVGDEKESDASTVCVDHKGRAYLPGSGIKGALRDLVKDQAGKIDPAWEPLLGSDSPNSSDSVGGKLEFWDAFWTEGEGRDTEHYKPDQAHAKNDIKRPWWDDTRKTCVSVSVSLDRRTKTPKENLLYPLEYVPAGESFGFEIGGDNLSPEDIARLLALIDRLDDGSATLGAQASNGWGRVAVNKLEISCLDVGAMEKWKKNPQDRPPLSVIDDTTREDIFKRRDEITPPKSSDQLVIKLQLVMESPWLIRDPRQRERSKAAKENDVADKPSNAVPIHDETGKSFAPAKSIRGALRARAEMILRTLDLPCAAHPGGIPAVSTKGKGKGTDAAITDIRTKDLAAQLFGFGGWRAPLEVTRLTQQGGKPVPKDHHQEFVAIDRFTGGAADGAKFDADLAGITILTGTLTVDLGRLGKVDPTHASLGLLALVLRDLAEGDIPLGSGSAKGQGFCRLAENVSGTHGGRTFGTLKEWFSSEAVTAALAAFRAEIKTSDADKPDQAAA